MTPIELLLGIILADTFWIIVLCVEIDRLKNRDSFKDRDIKLEKSLKERDEKIEKLRDRIENNSLKIATLGEIIKQLREIREDE
jgi:predicted Holliday junction resolvase-like endonuclease